MTNRSIHEGIPDFIQVRRERWEKAPRVIAARAAFPCDDCRFPEPGTWHDHPEKNGLSKCQFDQMCLAAFEDFGRPEPSGQSEAAADLNEGRTESASGAVDDGKGSVKPPPGQPKTEGDGVSADTSPSEAFAGAPFMQGCIACGGEIVGKIGGFSICVMHVRIITDHVSKGVPLPWEPR
jgi:hypothetical protein